MFFAMVKLKRQDTCKFVFHTTITIHTMKVLYNACYGGFNFSKQFVEEFNARHPDRPKKLETWYEGERTDPGIIALFEEKGSVWSSGAYAKLDVEEIPDDVEFHIREYDGMEGVAWSIPKDEIIQDLMDIIKGRKKEEETSKFTQMMIQKDLTPYQLHFAIKSTSS